MKKLVLLFSCLFLIGCGEKKETGDNGPSDNDEVVGESVTAETEAPTSPEQSEGVTTDKESGFTIRGGLLYGLFAVGLSDSTFDPPDARLFSSFSQFGASEWARFSRMMRPRVSRDAAAFCP